jgi:hypothetical protein
VDLVGEGLCVWQNTKGGYSVRPMALPRIDALLPNKCVRLRGRVRPLVFVWHFLVGRLIRILLAGVRPLQLWIRPKLWPRLRVIYGWSFLGPPQLNRPDFWRYDGSFSNRC